MLTYVTAADVSPFPRSLQRKSRGKKSLVVQLLFWLALHTSSNWKDFRRKVWKYRNKQLLSKGRARRAFGLDLPNVSPRQTDDGASSAKKTSRNKSKQKSSAGVLEDWTPCGICSVTFVSDVQKKTGRRWVMCCKCNCWYHNECQGLRSNARPNNCVFLACGWWTDWSAGLLTSY